MFDIDIRLRRDDWRICEHRSKAKTILEAYMAVKATIEKCLEPMQIQILPLGNFEFIVWGQGKCQGYLQLMEIEDSDDVG
jgi:hypothetical protein